MMKRLVALLLTLLLTGSVLPLAAAESEKEVYYTGGVVSRVIPRGADVELLQVAYVTNDAPYLILNEPTLWEITISGGKAPYTCNVEVCYREFDKIDQDNFPLVYSGPLDVAWGYFYYNFVQPGQYFLNFYVADAAGQKLAFQTQLYETYTAEDETNPTTVAGKVNSLINELISDDMSDYGRALILHDWLIYHANYDDTLTYYGAEGVLLYGTGVCDSYAKAYQMLCTAAGLECLRVSGYGDGGRHAWNLVRIGGEWFHVDCTWDDPGTGLENHGYFLLTDEEMARDHEWRRDVEMGTLVPETGEKQEEDPNFHYDLTFTTVSELDTRIDAVIADTHKDTYYMLYQGDDVEGMTSQFETWLNSKAQTLYGTYPNIQGISYTNVDSNQVFRIFIQWGSRHDYVTLAESSIDVSIGAPCQLKPMEYAPQADVFTWTSSDPTIATASGSYTDADGLIMTVTGHKAGTATITITSKDGFCDSIEVEVMPPHQPDFDLRLDVDSKNITLTWNGVPGATEYQIYRSVEGQEQLLATLNNITFYIPLEAAQFPANVRQQFYVKALRKVDGGKVLTYTSEPVSYGRPSISYNATLPVRVKTISEMAFMGDTSLTTFAVPAGVKTIEANAFADCTGLTALRIPDSVSSIAGSAFAGCPLKYVEVSEGSYADQWFAANFPNVERIY